MAKHDVAIPVREIRLVDGKFVLAGATKDALKAMPPFEYAQRREAALERNPEREDRQPR